MGNQVRESEGSATCLTKGKADRSESAIYLASRLGFLSGAGTSEVNVRKIGYRGAAVGDSLVGGGWNNFPCKDSNSWQSQGSTYP